MAWDAKASSTAAAPTGRRRQNSVVSMRQRAGSAASTTISVATTAAAAAPITSSSSHLADPFLKDLMQANFDPASYWNTVLEATPASSSNNTTTSSSSTATSSSSSSSRTAADLAALSTHAQSTLSQVSANTNRLTSVLTQLTDDILRSGSRLAYEVELLRGETIGLAEVLAAQNRASATALSTPGDGTLSSAALADQPLVKGVPEPASAKAKTKGPDDEDEDEDNNESPSSTAGTPANDNSDDPPALRQLRMLAQVRERLDTVIRAFGDAMEFVMPPSALSVSASFLSVSGPGQDEKSASGSTSGSGGSNASPASMEDKGQQVLKAKRDEIAKLLSPSSSTSSSTTMAVPADADADLETAAAKVEALRELCQVWHGTAEEKARAKFVESLQRMVEDRQRQLERERRRERERIEREREREQLQQLQQKQQQQRKAAGQGDGDSNNAGSGSAASSAANRGYAAGYGFISQLQKIRSGL